MLKQRVAIIPARGGSKRIPKKNIIDFGGKPMIAWTITAALESQCFEHVIVSTDDQEIAEISEFYGAEVPFLRDSNADDYSSISQATVATLRKFQDFTGNCFTTTVQLMANCPLRNKVDIVNAVTAFEEHKRTFQISCFKFGWMNPWWALSLDEEGNGKKLFSEAINKRSQDLGDLYCPTGAIWIANTRMLLNQNSFYGEGHQFQPMPWINAIDIDEYEDLNLALAMDAYLNKV